MVMKVHIASSSAKCFENSRHGVPGPVSLGAVAGHCQCIRKEALVVMVERFDVGTSIAKSFHCRNSGRCVNVVLFSRLDCSKQSRIARHIDVSTCVKECLDNIVVFVPRRPSEWCHIVP